MPDRAGRILDAWEHLVSSVVAALIGHGYIAYIVILAVMIIEEGGLPFPIPGDGLLLLAGYLASLGVLNLPVCLLVIDGGALMGSTILYWLARRGGRTLVLRYGRYIRLKEERLDQLAGLFGRLGPFGPGISRLIPGLRIYTSALAGLALVPYPIFVFNIAWACTIWALAFLWIGSAVGDRWRDYTHLSQQVTIYSAAAIALLIAGWWLLRKTRRRQQL